MEMDSSSGSVLESKYDVFLSYRSEDTGKNFVDHLYEALLTKGIHTFRHDKNLERGEDITSQLLNAIHESWCSVVVLTSTFAFSTRCLNELVEIIERKRKTGDYVYPIFYDVDPSEVRKQTGKIQEALVKHEETFKDKAQMIQTWKVVLTEVANLSGWHISHRHESDVIREIVLAISEKLRDTYTSDTNGLVGIHKRWKHLEEKLHLNSDDVRFIGICGMGGIGKTTLARFAYELMSTQFEAKSFLANVREKSGKGKILSVQKQLLSQILGEEPVCLWDVQDAANMIKNRLRHRKVLIVIDDVDGEKQLNYLAKNHDWFGLGSRVIIVSRNEHLLKTCGVELENILKPTTLNEDEALQLLSLKAFKSNHPREDYLELCKSILKYADGLPLALEVLGSFLCGRDKSEWESAVKRLKKDSQNKVFNILQISFDGLQETEKNIFLDIACFFKGKDKNYVTEVLDSCDFDPVIGISVLIEKSLLYIPRNKFTSVEGNEIQMHDLVQDMGQRIVEQESPNQPGKRSRIWREDDVRQVLTENTGTEAVEGIVLKGTKQKILVNAEAFSHMRTLRLLIISNLDFPHGLSYLPSNLRYLDWHGCPLKFLPSSYQSDSLIRLNMPHSQIVRFWEERKHLPKLKSIDVSHSQHLIETPNLGGAVNLESLKFEMCTRLSSVHLSTGSLKCLTYLNFKDCKILENLPSSVNGLKSLKTLKLSGCSKFENLPENFGQLECLEKFKARGTRIRKLPCMSGLKCLSRLCLDCCGSLSEIHPSVGTLTKLVCLSLENCKSLRRLPISVNGLKSLERLYLTGCSSLETLPEDLGAAKCLKEINLRETGISQLPSSINCLTNLQKLHLHGCEDLSLCPLSGLDSLKTLDLSGCNLLEGAIPNDIGSLSSLSTLNLSNNNFVSLPASISQLTKLVILDLENCKLNLLPSLSGFSSLFYLHLRNCDLIDEAILSYDLSFLSSLCVLDLSYNNFTILPTSVGRIQWLDQLWLDYCKKLQSIPELPSNLRELSARDCVSLETLPDVLPNETVLVNCFKLMLDRESNSLASAMLKRYFQAPSAYMNKFFFVVPGFEMPEWFSHQNKGNTLMIQLPANLNKNSQWVGLAICIVFTSGKQPSIEDKNDTGFSFREIVDGQSCSQWPNCRVCVGLSSHCFILYLPNWQVVGVENCSPFGFAVVPDGPEMEINEVGICIIYDKDRKDCVQSTSQHHSSWSKGSNRSPMLFKRSHQYKEDPSEFGEIDGFPEEPQPKKLKKTFDLITAGQKPKFG